MPLNTKPIVRRLRITAAGTVVISLIGAGLGTLLNGYGRGPKAFLILGAVIGIGLYLLAPLLAWAEKTRRPDPPDQKSFYP